MSTPTSSGFVSHDIREPFNTYFPDLWQEVAGVMCDMPKCHGWDHTWRVWQNCRKLLEVEKADSAVVHYAALLHDIGRAEEFRREGKICHAEKGAAQVPLMLETIGILDPNFTNHVQECVRTHRYRNSEHARPQSIEARIVFDADKLDSMGAIGTGRAFHFAGGMGARVHNTEQEALAASSYSVNDTAFREYLVKMRKLREVCLTSRGKALAAHRHNFMERFFEELNQETSPK